MTKNTINMNTERQLPAHDDEISDEQRERIGREQRTKKCPECANTELTLLPMYGEHWSETTVTYIQHYRCKNGHEFKLSETMPKGFLFGAFYPHDRETAVRVFQNKARS